MRRFDALLVALGGFVGAPLRYGIDLALPAAVGATLTVNVLGSFALGLFVAAVHDRRAHLLVGTGLLSSFTTYSTFAVQTLSLAPALGVGNVLATYALGLLAAAAGLVAGRRIA